MRSRNFRRSCKNALFSAMAVCCSLLWYLPNAIAQDISSCDQAYALLLDRLPEHGARGLRIFVAPLKAEPTVTLPLWNGERTLSGGPGWLFFVDDHPMVNWEHACRYVLVREDGGLKVLHARSPLKDMKGWRELTTWAGSSTLMPVPIPADEASIGSTASQPFTPAANRYAVIISGGYSLYSNTDRYWNDCAYFFTTLKQNGFRDENIHVIMSDGTDPADDMVDFFTWRTLSSPLDLDGDGRDDIRYSATKANLALVFDELGKRLGQDDILYIFTTDHGGTAEDNPSPYAFPDVTLGLWDKETMSVDEFKAEVNKVNAGVIVGIFEQCYSGGFVEKLAAPNRVLMSAARWWEWSWDFWDRARVYDAFSYYATRALADPVEGDTNGDGLTTLEEAYLYALAKDPEDEHPAYYSNPWDLGRQLSLLGIDPAAPAPRYAGYRQVETGEPYPSPGLAQGWQADDAVWAYDLPFDFPLQGETYDTVLVSSNGILFFGPSDISGENRVERLARFRAAAPLWDDLTTEGPDNDIYVDAAEDQVTFTWAARTRVDDRPVNMAARLYPDGTITFYYGEGNRLTSAVEGRDKTIGVSTGNRLHLCLRNGASILDKAPAIAFIPYDPLPDIRANGSDGPITVLPEDPVSISVRLDPGKLYGMPSDWWVNVSTTLMPPDDGYSYAYPDGWSAGFHRCIQSDLFCLNPSFEVLNTALLPGTYTFSFGLTEPDGTTARGPWLALDSVRVTVGRQAHIATGNGRFQ